jgi:excisionase family DNA binding protein
MENVFLTSLTTPEVRQLFRDELENFFSDGKTLVSAPPVAIPESDIEFDIPGLAKYLKCSIQTIHNLKKEGVLSFYRLGRKVYFKKSEIDRTARVSSIGAKKKG